MDALLNFYKTVIDSLHFYLFHLYDSGLRVLRKKTDEKEDEEDIEDGNNCFDKEFARIQSEINIRKEESGAFSRFENVTKFGIGMKSKQGINRQIYIEHDLLLLK